MKSKLTPKENYLRLTRGECPDWIPLYTMGFPGYKGESATRVVGPSLLDETHLSAAPAGEYYDCWGVKYIANASTNFACIPEPGHFILDDITKWRDIIKAPKVPDQIDWEKLAKEDFKKANIDRSQSAVMATIGLMPFQQFIAFMGFTEGFLALYEEPEECKALLNFMADIYMPIVEATVDYYDPDIVYLLDDTASAMNPFISPEMYREILKPVYLRLTKPARDRGIPIQFHNCGRCEDFIDDMLDLGVKVLDPAQPMNDLLGIKKKYAGKLALAGAFQWTPPSDWPDTKEEVVRQMVRDCIDKYAPGGGYAFCGMVLSSYGNEVADRANGWMTDESYEYGRDYYLK